MKIHEYQAKEILRTYGVPTPSGEVARTPDEAREVAGRLGGPCMVKAQIHAGGRGKGGGVRKAEDPVMAAELATRMLGMTLVTPQTGPAGRVVRRLLLEETLDIARELYLAVTLDRSSERLTLIASAEGGVEIEKVAAETPEKILKESIDPAVGLSPFQARRLAFGLGLSGPAVKSAVKLMAALVRCAQESDASLVEINPLVVTTGGEVVALDAKMNFDDNALHRHPEIRELRDTDEEDPLEVEASRHGLNYIKLEGNVGCMVNGAGLAMATMDIIKLAGGQPANFLDVGGGASAEQVSNAFKILISDESVKAVLINIFGGILRCDLLAQGVANAVDTAGVEVPVIVRMEGTNVAEGRRILAESKFDFIVAEGMQDAATKAVAAAREQS
ncbi:MAG: ADP-forming succinate--CoA ligase subunit beta [Acidobacteria bacterium]|nr:MAG: ADP-forming succinate--CoA ligase subunit beta [Acidobacteriota bacterium]